MLTIRPEQFAVFSRLAAKRFEDQMVVHLNKFFPRQCEAAGEPQIRKTIQHGIERAAAYGVTAERDVCKYIDLMIVFGSDFDADELLPWAGEILRRRSHPAARMRALHRSAQNHLRRS